MNPDEIENAIAIIGMSGRFPGGDNIQKFWHNLCQGNESISFFSPEELEKTNLSKTQNFVNARGILDNIEYFDADFFGFSPQEAQITDPQHRLFLECSWEALEDAGYNPDIYQGRVGVYGGTGLSSYFLNNLYPNQQLKEKLSEYLLHIGNDKDFLTTRVSYKMNLKGPSLNIQTACSTSLVAICIACNHLQSYQCDMALAGAASITTPQKAGYLYQEGMIFSPDGHCKPFDAEAQGTVPGNGVGIVVLKRLEDALADRDHIYAVIRGYGTNNDGHRKMGYSAPSVHGQIEAIHSAFEMAGINPDTISYVEAHGTGTILGDPIEIEALSQVFHEFTQEKGFCSLGSVKGNVGHLMEAAGVAGLIKTTMAFQHQLLPPTLHFKNPNPHIDFLNSPFYINTTLSKWKVNHETRRACVSSFGIGGTNAHVILEEPLNLTLSPFSRDFQLILLSAKTPTALKTIATNLAQYLLNHQSIPLADIVYTLQIGRKTFEHRQMFISANSVQAAAQLLQFNSDDPSCSNSQSKIVFLLADEGVEYLYMGLELYQKEPCYRSWVDKCAKMLDPYLGIDLREVLYPADKNIETAKEFLLQKKVRAAALFVTEYALAKLWEEWGILPQEIVGYGIGEYVAACLAEVFTLEDAFQLIMDKCCTMKVKLSQPKIPFVSNFTSTWITLEQALSIDYWTQPIQKMDLPHCLDKEANHIFIEISPGSKLCDVVRNHLPQSIIKLTLSSLPDAKMQKSDVEILLTSLGHLWCAGFTVDWSGFYKHEKRSRVPLPSYPFEKKRFWIDPPIHTETSIQVDSVKESKTNLENSLVSIWKEYLGIDSIDIHEDFFLLGGDSLLAIQIISQIQTTFGITLKAHALLEFPTIAQLTHLISQEIKAKVKNKEQDFPSSIVKLKEGGKNEALFLIHPIGGQVFCYKALVDCMKYDGPIYGIQADYIDSEQFLNLNSIEDISSYYLNEIRKMQPKGPYQLLGFSFGGLIAYEIARQLQESNSIVKRLTMLDSICPDFLNQKRIKSNTDMINLLIELFEGKPFSDSSSLKSPKKQLERLMKSMNLDTLPLIEQKKIFDLTKRYCRALMQYHAKPYYGKVSFLQAKERFFRTNEISLGETWKELCKEGMILHEISGNHLSMLSFPHVKEIASFLDSNLN